MLLNTPVNVAKLRIYEERWKEFEIMSSPVIA
jgi:hypothetical protein